MTAEGLARTRSSAGTTAVLRIGALVLACGMVCGAQAAQQTAGSATSSPPAAPAKTASGAAQTGLTAATKKTARKKHHAAAAGSSKSSTTSSAASSSTSAAKRTTSSSRKKRTVRTRGQQKIDSDRVQEIQEALIREHYLSGEASGKWNETSEAAMRKYQGDHGWQTKTVPDSRALIKLGLGPSHDHLLNPESAMTTGPDAPHASATNPAATHADPPSTASQPRAEPASADPQ